MTEKIKILFMGMLLFASIVFADWDGSSSKPKNTREIDGKVFYEISSPEELAWFAAQVNSGKSTINAVLANDIKFMDDMSKTSSVNWTPVGKDSTVMFNGIFDGAGRTVYGLYCNRGKFAGMFGVTDKDAVIKNVQSINSGIKAYEENGFAGGIVACNSGLVKKISNKGGVSRSTSTINARTLYGYSGGIVGWNSNTGIIVECTNNGSVFSGSVDFYSYYVYSGGIVGYNSGSVENCVNNGFVEVSSRYFTTDSYSGGIVGLNSESGSIADCTNEGEVYSDSGGAGIAGYNLGAVTNCVNSGSLNGCSVGGIVENNSGSVINCVNSDSVRSYCSSGGIAVYNYGIITSCTNNGAVSAYGGVSGGIAVYNSGNVTDCINNGTIYASEKPSGGIVLENSGTVSNCTNYGTISSFCSFGYRGGRGSGGIVAYNKNSRSKVINCTNKGLISATCFSDSLEVYSYFGGVVGRNEGSVVGCTNDGRVSVTSGLSSIGGIVGGNFNTVEKNINRGSIVIRGEEFYSGGIVGMNDSSAKIFDGFSVCEGDSVLAGVVNVNKGAIANCYYDSDILVGLPTVTPNAGLHTTDMQRNQFAWILNTANGATANSETWSRDSVGYPVFADSSHKPIYKIIFEDSNETINRYTNYKGMVDLPTNLKVLDGKMFFGWFTDDSVKVEPMTVFTKDQSVHAVYIDAADVYFSIRFFNSDSTLLDSQYVQYGKLPSFSGTPTKASSAQYSYIFEGWNVNPDIVVKDFDYYATYSESVRFYTVRFLDYDGSELQKSSFFYGVTPKIAKTPTRVSTVGYNYTFAGWTPEIEKVAEPAVYMALYDSSLVSQGDISSSSSSNAKPSSSESSFSSSSAKYSSSSVSQYSSSSLESSDAIVVNFSTPEWKISVSGRNFLIHAAPIGEVYSLFDMQGKVLAKGRVKSSEKTLSAPRAGSYIVRIGESSVRVNAR